MSGEQQPFNNDPAQMRVNLQAATQRAVGSPPPCGHSAAASGKIPHFIPQIPLPPRPLLWRRVRAFCHCLAL